MSEKIFTQAQKAALDHTRHIALTANAGSGKTFVLTERLLSILLNDADVTIKNIAAITFTEKAASELYKKIAAALDEQIEKSQTDEEKEKFIKFRKYLVSAQITTIHSFCANLLREFPVEAGIDADFAILDEYSATRMMEQSLASLIEEMQDDPMLLHILRLLKGTANFAHAMMSMLGKREIIEKVKETIYSGEQDEIAERIQSHYLEAFRNVILPLYEPCLSALSYVNTAVLAADAKNKYALAIAPHLRELLKEDTAKLPTKKAIALFAEIQGQVLKKDMLPKQVWVKKIIGGISPELTGTIIDFYELLEFAETENDPSFGELAAVGNELLQLFLRLMDKYNKKKKENAFLDFDDLALLTKELLKNNYVKATLAARFKYIMIDEYQDTNELQYEIFMPILHELQQGNLFIVGDEKQSIYMFRNAELAVFDRTKKDIVRREDETANITLKESFRMAPELGLFVNRIFEVLFAKPRAEYNESRHSEMIYIERTPKVGTVTFLVAKQNSEEETETEATGEELSDTSFAEAELVARQILNMKEQYGYGWKDFGVLSFKNNAFSVFRTIFPAYHIPYMIYGGKGFYETQAVLDISCYLQFLTDERNDLALAAVLKSPFYLLDDTALMNISVCPGNSFYSKLQQYAQKDEKINRVSTLLEKHLAEAKYAGAPHLLRSLLDDTLFTAILSNRPDGDQILADIEKVLAMAIERESAGFENLYDFATFLRSAIEEGIDETHAALAVAADAVQLMTIHKSKGLEFKAVILCEANTKFIPERLVEGKVYVDRQAGILTKLPVNGNYFDDYQSPPPALLYNYIRRKKQQAEQKRFLYVALTRAEEHLLIAATLNKKNEINANSMLSYIAEALGEHIVEREFTVEGTMKCLRIDAIDQPPELRRIAFTVPVVEEISEIQLPEEPDQEADHQYIINLEKVKEKRGAYIISASGYVRFSQCPLQFHLYQHQRLHEFMESEVNREYVLDFDDDADNADDPDNFGSAQPVAKMSALSGFAMTRGTILHKLLEQHAEGEHIAETIAGMLFEFDENPSPALLKAAESVAKDYREFVASEAYKEIASQPHYENEYEIATVIDDKIYLNGVIDRMVWDGDSIRIVDWKTDQVDRGKLAERCSHYEKQLLFYAFIISRLFPEAKSIEYTIAFVSHRNFVHSGAFKQSDFEQFEKEIRGIICAIDEKEYPKKTAYCRNCVFSGRDRQCVVRD